MKKEPRARAQIQPGADGQAGLKLLLAVQGALGPSRTKDLTALHFPGLLFLNWGLK